MRSLWISVALNVPVLLPKENNSFENFLGERTHWICQAKPVCWVSYVNLTYSRAVLHCCWHELGLETPCHYRHLDTRQSLPLIWMCSLRYAWKASYLLLDNDDFTMTRQSMPQNLFKNFDIWRNNSTCCWGIFLKDCMLKQQALFHTVKGQTIPPFTAASLAAICEWWKRDNRDT